MRRVRLDRPASAFLADLKRRGLLEDTLVLFGSEFGRQPTAQGPDGRDHNITGYPMFLMGAGMAGRGLPPARSVSASPCSPTTWKASAAT